MAAGAATEMLGGTPSQVGHAVALTMQGTLGCYFRVGDDLYAATARHNVFSLNGDNEEYNYVGTFLST